MKLSDFIRTDAIIAELQATDRNGVIRELVEALSKSIGLDEKEAAAIGKSVITARTRGARALARAWRCRTSNTRGQADRRHHRAVQRGH